MNLTAAITAMLLLLIGPVAFREIERNLEVYIGAIRILAMLSSVIAAIIGAVGLVVCAGAVRVRSGAWVRTELPIGLALLGIYFAALQLSI